MKKVMLVTLVIFAAATFAMAQIGAAPTTDVLGAHLNYGRGCAACHAPHSGAYGNGAAKNQDPTSGNVALWGQDVGSLVGQTLIFGGTGPGTGYSETLPGFAAGTPDLNITLCLSCHDGNLAVGAMMKNAVYETLPPSYGTYNMIPTLLGNDHTTAGNYLNDHPVGLNAGDRLRRPVQLGLHHRQRRHHLSVRARRCTSSCRTTASSSAPATTTAPRSSPAPPATTST